MPSGTKSTMGSSQRPPGDELFRKIGDYLTTPRGPGRLKSTTVEPRKPLKSTVKPGPENNFGRGF